MCVCITLAMLLCACREERNARNGICAVLHISNAVAAGRHTVEQSAGAKSRPRPTATTAATADARRSFLDDGESRLFLVWYMKTRINL